MPTPLTAHPPADAATLDRLTARLRGLRAELAATRLAVPAAEDRLDHSDDLLAIVISQLSRAANDLEAAEEAA